VGGRPTVTVPGMQGTGVDIPQIPNLAEHSICFRLYTLNAPFEGAHVVYGPTKCPKVSEQVRRLQVKATWPG
jgi:hypothetical protein